MNRRLRFSIMACDAFLKIPDEFHNRCSISNKIRINVGDWQITKFTYPANSVFPRDLVEYQAIHEEGVCWFYESRNYSHDKSAIKIKDLVFTDHLFRDTDPVCNIVKMPL